jgi:hypothetical protein
MKTYGGVEVNLYRFWPRHWMEVSGQLHAPAFLPQERAPGTHWIGGLVRPRVGVGVVQNIQISCPCQKSNPGRPSRSPSLYRLSYHWPKKSSVRYLQLSYIYLSLHNIISLIYTYWKLTEVILPHTRSVIVTWKQICRYSHSLLR